MWFIQKAKTPYVFCALPPTFTWSRVVCLIPEPRKCPGFSAPWAGAGTQRSTLPLTGRARGGLHGRSRPEGVSLRPPSAPGLLAVPPWGPKPAGRRLQERPSPRGAGPQPPGLGAQSSSLSASLGGLDLLELAASTAQLDWPLMAEIQASWGHAGSTPGRPSSRATNAA